MTKASRFAGVFSALMTPFDKTGALDLFALSKIIAMQRREGIHGFVLAGSTGESATLTLNERVELVKAAKEMAHDLPIVVGAGSNCTKDAILWQKTMEDAGASATLQVVPYYNKPTQRGLYEHFSAIAKESKIPIILYNAAGRTGIDLSAITVAEIVKEHGNVIGIKEANTNMERLTELMDLAKGARPEFLVLCGEDSAFLPFLALGGDGIISVVTHMATMEMKAIYDAVKQRDLIYAQKISKKLHSLCKLLHSHPNPIPLKTIMASLGLVEKSFRLPLCALDHREEEALLSAFQQFRFLNSLKSLGVVQ